LQNIVAKLARDQ